MTPRLRSRSPSRRRSRPSTAGAAEPDNLAAWDAARRGLAHTADDALAESADTDDPPTQKELAAWFGAGNCPPETLAAVAERLAVLWDTEPGKVIVTGWAFGGLVTWLDGDMFHTPVAELLATAKRKNVPNPLAPLVNAWLERESAAYTSRHVQVVQTATGRYTKTPGLLATTSGQLEIVQVDGEPFAGRQPLMPKEGRTKAYRPAQPTQGELIAGPATIDGVPAGDLLLVGLDQWDLEEDKRTTLRHDIIQLGRAAYALTGRATIPEDVGAQVADRPGTRDRDGQATMVGHPGSYACSDRPGEPQDASLDWHVQRGPANLGGRVDRPARVVERKPR